MPKVLITGASGLLGRALMKEFSKKPSGGEGDEKKKKEQMHSSKERE